MERMKGTHLLAVVLRTVLVLVKITLSQHINNTQSLSIQDFHLHNFTALQAGTTDLPHKLAVLATLVDGAVLCCHPENHTCTRVGQAGATAKPYRPSFSVMPWSSGSFPAAVVKPRTAKDVQTSVLFAQQAKLDVCVKAGGHHGSTASFSQGTLLLDMSLMNHVSVDMLDGSVTAGAGALLGDINYQTLLYGVYVPLGWCYSVGQAYGLHGGVPIAPRQHGLTLDSITDVGIVTADGSWLHLSGDACRGGGSAADHCGLWWAVKGQASAFGVVTQVKYNTYSLEGLQGGALSFVDDDQHQVLRQALEYMMDVVTQDASVDMTLTVTYDPDLQQRVVDVEMLFGDGRSVAQQRQFVHPLLKLGPISDTIGLVPYANFTRLFTEEVDAWMKLDEPRAYWASGGVESREAAHKLGYITALVDGVVEQMPFSAHRHIELDVHLHADPSDGNAPAGISKLLSSFFIIGVWEMGDDDDHILRTLNRIHKGLDSGFLRYKYANAELLDDNHMPPDLVAFVGGRENWQRICAVKKIYDGKNVFRRHLLPGLDPASCMEDSISAVA